MRRLPSLLALALVAAPAFAQEPPAPAPVPEAPAPAPEAPAPEAPAPESPAPEAPAPEAPAPEAPPVDGTTTGVRPPEETPPVEVPVEPAPTTGEVTGTVLDPGGIPYPGLTIVIGETSVTTNDDGVYSVNLPPGEYLVTISEPGMFAPGDLIATVAAGQRTTVDVELQADNPEDYTIVVYAPEVVGGINASIEERRESAAVTEVLGAEQITKSGDSNASAALARVTGLTVVDGRFVFVRGLGERYSSSLLNLSTLPSPEPERRVVPLDLFPAGILESVTIYKTWSAELPGDFGGGVVSMKTRPIPDRPYNQLTVTVGYQAQTTFSEAQSGPRGPTDWLGFGLADRAIPQALADATANAQLVEGNQFSDGYTAEELETIGESVNSARWGLAPITVAPDLGLQAAFGRKLDLGGPALGVFAGLTYQNQWSYDDYRLTIYDVGGDGEVIPGSAYGIDELENTINLGAILNVGLEFSEDQSLLYTGFLSRSATYTARPYQGFNQDLGDQIEAARVTWVERQLLFNQLRGEHRFAPLADFTVEWRYALSTASRAQPDQREWRYDYEPPPTDAYQLSNRPEGNNIVYSTLDDVNHDARLDLTLPLGSDDRPGRLAAGAQYVLRDRGTDTRRFSYFERGTVDNALEALPPDQLFVADNIGVENAFQLEETTLNTDTYTAEQEVIAAYLLADFPVDILAHSVWGLRDLSVLAGARIEQSQQSVSTFQPFAPDLSPVVAELDNVDLLPSVTLTQALLPPPEDPNDDAMQVRLGYARTVNRPDFRELSQVTFYEVTGGREVFGNPDLERALIDHADLRWEWYPRQGELVSVGLFGKWFTNPIETVVVPSAQLSTTWENAKGATNLGVEAEARKTFFGLGVPFFDRMYVAVNGALIRSRIDLEDAGGVQTNTLRPLQGQSPWVLNAQLGYDNTDTKTIGTVSFNVAAARIVEVGALGAPDTFQEPVPRLDVLLQQGFARDFYVRLRGRNLLDPEVRVTQGGEDVRAGKEGWVAQLQLEWRP